MPKPYRIIAKIKNNRLWSAITDMFPEVRNQKHAAEVLDLGQQWLGTLLNMTVFPYCAGPKRKGWTRGARRLAQKLAHPVEYLFDPELYGRKPLSQVEAEIGPDELIGMRLISLPPAPDAAIEAAGLSQEIQASLLQLPARERDVLSRRYGLKGDPETLDEIAKTQGCGKERIRQIEVKALRRLRHPRLGKTLKTYR